MIRLIGRLLGAGITLLFIAASATLALNNPGMVSVSLWPWDISVAIPLWLVIVITFGAGVLIGGIAMTPSLMRQRLVMRALKKEMSKKEKTNLSESNEKPSLPAK